jgi:uncharacterized protein YjiS (DUF1127 family)
MLRTPGEASGATVPEAIGAPLSAQRTIFARLADAAVAIVLSMERVRQRRALAELDDRLLRDIGLTRADAWHEIRKPFWRR